MKCKVVDKSQMAALVTKLIREHEVFAPTKMKGYTSFGKISLGNEVHLDSTIPRKSPKEVLLPQTEVLFSYSVDKTGVELEPAPPPKKKAVLLGVRPCDSRALVLLDKFFSEAEHPDTCFSERRMNTAVVGLACNHPLSTCFCTSIGGNPSGKEGMDLLLQDIGDKYVMEPITEKGEKLIREFAGLNDAEGTDMEKAKALAVGAERAVTSKVPVEGLSGKLDELYDDPLWGEIQRKCLGCGVCTYLCPTCSCFDVVDEETEGWKRSRIWDSCQFSCFTMQGSGHNPRPSGKERMRQRIMHKFSYFFKNHDEHLCVGCGRCVQECPVNFDIREVIQGISAKQVGKD